MAASDIEDDDRVLLWTIQVYGGFFLVCVLLFCYLRPRLEMYNVRKKDDAEENEGQVPLSTFFRIAFALSDEEMLNWCGLDALGFLRVIKFGLKLAAVGTFNSIWLIYLYYTTNDTHRSVLVSISIANVPAGSPVLIGTVVAAYIVYICCGIFILQEFRWFVKLRNSFLSRKEPRNYTIFVRNVPEEFQGNEELLNYFQDAFEGESAVLEAHIAFECRTLTNFKRERKQIVAELETAEDSSQRNELEQELEVLNHVISQLTPSIQEYIQTKSNQRESSTRGGICSFWFLGKREETNLNEETPLVGRPGPPADIQVYSAGFVTFKSLRATQAALQMIQHSEPFAMNVQEAPQPKDVFWKNVGASHGWLVFWNIASPIIVVLLCFLWTYPVTIVTSLSTPEGLKKVDEDFLNWVNQQGFIPVFLKKILQWMLQPVIRWIDESQNTEKLFQIIAPLLIFVLRKVLEIILGLLSSFDGPISGSVIDASFFTKLAWFYIIQNFVVISLTGSIISELGNILGQPERIVGLLANSLPDQSTFFLQILLVDSFTSLGMELLRLVDGGIGLVKKLFHKKHVPLQEPAPLQHGKTLASLVIYFMVFFVYVAIAPITSVFIGVLFLLMGVTWRHQFFYIYPSFPDSGGRLWVRLFKLLPHCILISQVTLFGMISLKKSALGAQLVLLLIFMTVLFILYIGQEHFENASFLPARDALQADTENRQDANDEHFFDFVRNKYMQPELVPPSDEEEEGI